MVKKILVSSALIILIFLAFVATRPGSFHYERSGTIEAGAGKIFPYLTSFKLGSLWSPYERFDPNMKKTYSGPESGVGARMEFDGNSDIGAGDLEILKVVPNELVELRLNMHRPMEGSNLIQYKLTSEGTGTRFTWSMSGEGGFLSKLVGVFIDCEKMVGDQFNSGISNLKKVVESDNK